MPRALQLRIALVTSAYVPCVLTRHIGLQAKSKAAFLEIRRRLIARGAADAFVTDFWRAHSIFFRDPDGLEGEVLLWLSAEAPVLGPGTPATGYDDV